MSRDELPQYTPNTAVMSFEKHPRPFHSLWTTPDANPATPTITGTGLQTYPALLPPPVLRALSGATKEKVMKIRARVYRRRRGTAEVWVCCQTQPRQTFHPKWVRPTKSVTQMQTNLIPFSLFCKRHLSGHLVSFFITPLKENPLV